VIASGVVWEGIPEVSLIRYWLSHPPHNPRGYVAAGVQPAARTELCAVYGGCHPHDAINCLMIAVVIKLHADWQFGNRAMFENGSI